MSNHLVAGVVVVSGGMWRQHSFICECEKKFDNDLLLPSRIGAYHNVALVERSSKLLSDPEKVNVEAGDPRFRIRT